MKERDLKAGDLIQWKGGDIALVLNVSEGDVGASALGLQRGKEAVALFDDGKTRYIPDYQWHNVEVVSR